MDNASKALIMAGAILISIAIVGVGVYIFSSTSSMGNTAGQQIDATQAQMTNSTLRQYVTDRAKGTTVREFFGYVDVLNKNDTLPYDLVVNFAATAGGATTNITSTLASATITDNAYYSIEIVDLLPSGAVDGYLDTVTVKKK